MNPSARRTVLFVFGTRPEAIKLCPLILRLQASPERWRVRVCATAQHREMLDGVLAAFGVVPDYDLDVMRPGQTLFGSTSRILAGLEPVFADARPDVAVVQGDTTSTFCGALAAFYSGVPVAHVEAGLRTGDLREPFPEEANRALTGRIAALHFAATEGAAANLRREGITRGVHVTGNTGIDAVLHVGARLGPVQRDSRRLVLVTVHRRENFGAGVARVCSAIEAIAGRGDVRVVFPVHPNPNISGPVRERLGSRANISLVEPLDYVRFVELMSRAHVILTDSGGIQEEAPSLGVPVLVLRDRTERPEAVEAGTVRLVGTDAGRIVRETARLLDSAAAHARMARRHNPYGDGRACLRIEAALRQYLARGTAVPVPGLSPMVHASSRVDRLTA